jgi:hypothetical protein
MAQMKNLDFLLEDLNRQREIAQSAIDDAKKLAEPTDDDPAVLRAKLEEAKQALLRVATSLQVNATTTSSAAQITILNFKPR